MERVSIIIPIIRPESAMRCIYAICKDASSTINGHLSDGINSAPLSWQPEIIAYQTAFINGEYVDIQIIALEDTEGTGCPRMVKRLVEKAKYDLVMFLGDDTEPQPGFLKAALDEMAKIEWGVVGLNTEDPRGTNPMAHWLAHKKMLDHIPGGDFFSTEYLHCFCDNELKDIAVELGRWAYAEDSKIKHNHPVNKSAGWDEGYESAYEKEKWEHDRKCYFTRKRNRMKEKHGIRLGIAEPLTDNMVYSHFHFSSVRTITSYMSHLYKNGNNVAIDFLAPNYPGQIDAIRNGLVSQAQMFGCTHILMMDTDQIYADPEMIQKMLAHEKPVVGAKVHRRYPPFDPLLLRGDPGGLYSVPDDEIESNGLIEVGATGCGCILYDMEVFDKIDPPWFELTTGEFGQPVGEDVGFCEKLKKAGYKIMVDCSIDIKHLSLLAVDWGTHKLYKKLKGVN